MSYRSVVNRRPKNEPDLKLFNHINIWFETSDFWLRSLIEAIMTTNLTILLIVITMTSVATQTFQYSRGWTNGKRDGHKREEISIDKILNPCQMQKLKYLLEGKPLSERLLAPCDYIEDDTEQPKRYKSERGQDPLYDVFQ